MKSYAKQFLYALLGILIIFNLSVLFIFNADTKGISYFTVVDPETGIETTVENCEQLHAFELLIRDCVGW